VSGTTRVSWYQKGKTNLTPVSPNKWLVRSHKLKANL